MARPLRLEHAGAVWHVTSRGNALQDIFLDDGDREEFLRIVARSVDVFRWTVHGYVLMSNHYHLLLDTPEPNLSRGMRQLNGIYTQRFNRRHQRVGHVFQGRFKAILVEKNTHLLELARYLALNPVRAGMVKSASGWPWSSYRATVGLAERPAWLEVEWLLAQFGGASPAETAEHYGRFVAEAVDGRYLPWAHLVGQVYLGGKEFIAGVERRLQGEALPKEHPRAQRMVQRPSAAELVQAVADEFGTSAERMREVRRGDGRKALAHLGRTDGALRLREIGAELGIADWSVTNLAKAGERLEATDQRFRHKLGRVRTRLRSEHGRP